MALSAGQISRDFSDAFELANENEKENEQKGPSSLLLRLQKPDQRHVVIRAVAKRDPAWAGELTRQLLKPVDESEAASTRSSFENLLTASRLLDSAIKMLATEPSALTDKFQRSISTLSVTEGCLQQAPKAKPQKRAKP